MIVTGHRKRKLSSSLCLVIATAAIRITSWEFPFVYSTSYSVPLCLGGTAALWGCVNRHQLSLVEVVKKRLVVAAHGNSNSVSGTDTAAHVRPSRSAIYSPVFCICVERSIAPAGTVFELSNISNGHFFPNSIFAVTLLPRIECNPKEKYIMGAYKWKGRVRV